MTKKTPLLSSKDFFKLIWKEKIWWLTPLIIILLFLSVLIILTEVPVAPFIYVLF